MYSVIISENKNGKEISKSYDFIGKLTDDVEEAWARIEKNSNFKIRCVPYSTDSDKGDKRTKK